MCAGKYKLENSLGDLIEPLAASYVSFNSTCSARDDDVQDYSMPVKRDRLSKLLACMFAINPSSVIVSTFLAKKNLSLFHEAG